MTLTLPTLRIYHAPTITRADLIHGPLMASIGLHHHSPDTRARPAIRATCYAPHGHDIVARIGPIVLYAHHAP